MKNTKYESEEGWTLYWTLVLTDIFKFVYSLEMLFKIFLFCNFSLIGGFSGSSSSNEVYSLEGDTGSRWKTMNPMSIARREHSCSYRDGEVWVLGGRLTNLTQTTSVEIYNLTTGRWRAGPDLPSYTVGVRDSQAIIYDGELYVIGGEGSNGRILRLNTSASWSWDEVATSGPTL